MSDKQRPFGYKGTHRAGKHTSKRQARERDAQVEGFEVGDDRDRRERIERGKGDWMSER